MKYVKHVLFLLACLGLTVAGCSPVTRPQWWKFRSGVDNRASGQVDGAQGNLAPFSIPLSLLVCPVLWSDQQHKSWFDSRIVVGDVGFLHEFAPGNGTEIDSFRTQGTIESCPSAQPDTNVIYATDAALYKLFALNPYNLSNALWSAPLPHGTGCTVLTSQPICGLGLPTPPLPYGNLVIVGAGTELFAFKPGTTANQATIAWRYNIGTDQFVSTFSGPALSQEVDSAVVIAGRNGKVVKVLADETLGINQQREVWTYTVGNNTTVTEAVALGLDLSVYVPTNDGWMYALRPDADLKGKPRERWSFHNLTNAPLTAPAVAFVDHPSTEVVYFADNTKLYALDARGGWPYWGISLPAAATTAPVVTQNNTVYVGVGQGTGASIIGFDRNQKMILKVPRPGTVLPGTVRNLAVAENGSIWALAGTKLIRVD